MVRILAVFCCSGVVAARQKDGLDHRRQLFEQVRANEGGTQPTDTQRWVGAQSAQDGNVVYGSSCSFSVPLDSEIEMMPNSSLGQAHYMYCDLHHFWPDGLFTQFVPQLQRGDMTCSSDSDYDIGGCQHDEAWYIQAQYIWSESVGPSTAQSTVKGWVGDLIKVSPGDQVFSNITYTTCDGKKGWSLEISANGGTPSSLCVTTPFMGREANYSSPYSSGCSDDCWEFILGDLHEAWNMNSAGYYPTSQTYTVNYHGKNGHSVNADQANQDACDNHNTGGSCADNVLTPSITSSSADEFVFTNKRDSSVVV